MMESVCMNNPMSKMRNKQFLKKKRSIEEPAHSSSRKAHILSHRAVAIKERATSSPSPPQRQNEEAHTHRRKHLSHGL